MCTKILIRNEIYTIRALESVEAVKKQPLSLASLMRACHVGSFNPRVCALPTIHVACIPLEMATFKNRGTYHVTLATPHPTVSLG